MITVLAGVAKPWTRTVADEAAKSGQRSFLEVGGEWRATTVNRGHGRRWGEKLADWWNRWALGVRVRRQAGFNCVLEGKCSVLCLALGGLCRK